MACFKNRPSDLVDPTDRLSSSSSSSVLDLKLLRKDRRRKMDLDDDLDTEPSSWSLRGPVVVAGGVPALLIFPCRKPPSKALNLRSSSKGSSGSETTWVVVDLGRAMEDM